MDMTMENREANVFDQVLAGLSERGLDLATTQVRKNNGSRTGVHVKGMNVSPTVYKDQVECYVKANGLPEAINFYESVLTNEVPVFDVNRIVSRDYILENGIPCVVQRKGNEELLDGLVSTDYLDLAVYYRIILDADLARVGETASVSIKPEMLTMAGINRDELHEAAAGNLHPVMFHMNELLQEMIGAGCAPLPEETATMLVVTNESKYQGAANIINTKIFKDISDDMDSDLWILPSSIHELIVVPCDQFEHGDADELRDMVTTINAEQVAPEDQLSDSVYRYIREQNAVEIC